MTRVFCEGFPGLLAVSKMGVRLEFLAIQTPFQRVRKRPFLRTAPSWFATGLFYVKSLASPNRVPSLTVSGTQTYWMWRQRLCQGTFIVSTDTEGVNAMYHLTEGQQQSS